MRKRDIVVFPVLVLLFGLVISAFLFFKGVKEQRVLLSNQSKNYTITYKENETFSALLDKWGVWIEKKISIDNAINAYTAKRIQIIITDQPQTEFKVIDKSTPPISFAASNAKMDKDTLVVYAYLNKDRLNSTQPHEFGYLKDIDGFFLWIVLDAIYTSTHMTDSHANLKENTFQINTAIKELRDANKDPFTILVK
ncbi:MAG: hypothetical protein HY431_02965 [Candidatus Levybacteria bacterium]|nr:hypothetical protein [Candidatus Levybacteria bacterium]